MTELLSLFCRFSMQNCGMPVAVQAVVRRVGGGQKECYDAALEFASGEGRFATVQPSIAARMERVS